MEVACYLDVLCDTCISNINVGMYVMGRDRETRLETTRSRVNSRQLGLWAAPPTRNPLGNP
ncbi:hypothetical protein Hanom_Chr17g01581341 [Helianthus anomalus]